MTDVQEHLLKLLVEIDGICRENGIEYFLDGGSALGAVRHRGFLPWDDDADIVMTRGNWEKFRRVVTEHPRTDRLLADPTDNPDYPMIYPRYCDTSTTAILRTSMIGQFRSGLFIDIFILDPVEDTREAVEEYFDILSGYCEYLNPYYYDTVIGANKWFDFFRDLNAREGREAADRFLENKLFRGEDREGMTYCFRFDLEKFVYPRYLFRRQLFLPVEDQLLPVPCEFGDYLRIHYGDLWYMIPTATDVETHNVVIDLEVPYDSFAASYMGAIDREEAKKNYQRFQQLRLKKYRMTSEIDTARYRIVAKTFAAIVKKRAADCPPAELLAAGKYEALAALFENYETIQLNRFYYRNGVLIPMGDELLYCVLRLMIHEGRYNGAAKILRLRARTEGPLDERLSELQSMIDSIRALLRHLELGEWEQALALARTQRERYPDVPDYVEAEFRARERLAGTKEACEALLDELLALPPVLLEREWVTAVRERLNVRADRERERAEQRLRALCQQTYNGLIRLEINDFLSEQTEGAKA